METQKDVLVIGAGIAGMEVSLLLAGSGRKVYLVEKTSFIGGNVIKFEEVFPNLECSTCMVAPKQQEVLGNSNIELLTLTTVESVSGSVGNFKVKVKKRARYVDLINCIGCNECFAPCPVELQNEYEEKLGTRKAIYIPYPGTLPNVPAIDTQNCLRFNGKDKECQLCQESCMFEAIDFTQQDEELELNVGAIVVATGFNLLDLSKYPRYGYGKFDNVYNAFEFERLFASNGPTEGKIVLRNGKEPQSAAIIHCGARKEAGYCSGVCCMYSAKFTHYLKNKLPDIKIFEFYQDLCVPGKKYEQFFKKASEHGVELIRATDTEVKGNGKGAQIHYKTETGENKIVNSDLIIVTSPIEPGSETGKLAEILGIGIGEKGFFRTEKEKLAPLDTVKPGVFVAGCAAGPADIAETVAQAQAVAGRVLSTT